MVVFSAGGISACTTGCITTGGVSNGLTALLDFLIGSPDVFFPDVGLEVESERGGSILLAGGITVAVSRGWRFLGICVYIQSIPNIHFPLS